MIQDIIYDINMSVKHIIDELSIYYNHFQIFDSNYSQPSYIILFHLYCIKYSPTTLTMNQLYYIFVEKHFESIRLVEPYLEKN